MPDSVLLALIATLVVIGTFVFMSASFGLLTRTGAGWSGVLFSQIVLGLGGGVIFGLCAYILPVTTLRKYALYIFIIAAVACLLVFVPHVGMRAGGAARWIVLFGFSFQPSELMKIALILLLASWGAGIGEDIRTVRHGLIPYLGIVGIVGALIVMEPDTGTFLVIFGTSLALFLVAGGRIKHLSIVLGGALIMILILALVRPYVRARIESYLDSGNDPLGSSYQIRQSLLAIGSGKSFGRGFGQSVQKFQYLPEPIGDSVFAVLGEEFGFLGTTVIILLFLSLCLRGLFVAARAPTKFHRLLATGIVIMITLQAYMHIGAMAGILPLTGIPLPFVSHGGTALMFTLIELGMLLQISRDQKIQKE